MKLLFALLALVFAQLRGCVAGVCDVHDDSRFAVREIHTAFSGGEAVTGIAALAGGELAISTGAFASPADHQHRLYHWSERFGLRPLATLNRGFSEPPALLPADDERWWYSLAGVHQNRGTVTFVAGEGAGAPRATVVELPGNPTLWLPFAGTEPRGLAVVPDGTGGTRALEVAPAGIQASWPLDLAISRYPLRWSAQRLSDDRIALVTVESVLPPAAEDAIDLHWLARSAAATTTPLGRAEAIGEITMALGADGTVAIVVAGSGGVRAAFVDPSNVSTPQWHTLTAEGEIGRMPRATRTAAGMTIAWLSGSRGTVRLRARTLTPRGPALGPVTIASIVTRDEPSRYFALVEESGEELRVYWEADHLNTRRIPQHLAGFALYEWLRERFHTRVCGAAGS